MRKIIMNSTPLFAWAKANMLELLKKLYAVKLENCL